MMSTSHIQTLRAMLREEKGVILPGAPNALAARIIADLGFKAVYLTGAGLTNMHLGLPDLGFMDLSQVADHAMAIRCVVGPSLKLSGRWSAPIRRDGPWEDGDGPCLLTNPTVSCCVCFAFHGGGKVS